MPLHGICRATTIPVIKQNRRICVYGMHVYIPMRMYVIGCRALVRNSRDDTLPSAGSNRTTGILGKIPPRILQVTKIRIGSWGSRLRDFKEFLCRARLLVMSGAIILMPAGYYVNIRKGDVYLNSSCRTYPAYKVISGKWNPNNITLRNVVQHSL